MATYRFFCRPIEASIAIPELYPAEHSGGDVRVRMARAECIPAPLVRNLELQDGTLWATLRRGRSHFQLEFPDTATFAISGSGHIVDCYPRSSLPVATLRHLLLNQVLPLAFAQRRALVLHASGAVVDGNAIVFTGPAGCGKSTLAASFGRRFAVLSDDAILLGKNGTGITAVGSYADLRLWTDSAKLLLPPGTADKVLAHFSEKQRIIREGIFHFEMAPQPLARIYVLTPANESGINSIGPAEALIRLMGNAYRLDTSDYRRLARDQQFLARVVSSGVVRRLRLRHDFSELGRVEELVLKDLRAN